MPTQRAKPQPPVVEYFLESLIINSAWMKSPGTLAACRTSCVLSFSRSLACNSATPYAATSRVRDSISISSQCVRLSIDYDNIDSSQLAGVLQRRIHCSAIERKSGFDFPVLYSLFD